MDASPTNGSEPKQSASDSAAFWESHYQRTQPDWGIHPNAALTHVLEQLPARDRTGPGRALDLGAGHGGDAVWLAMQGWDVTAVDISPTALSRVGELAHRHDVTSLVHTEVHDLSVSLPDGPFDLITASYFNTSVDIDRRNTLRRAFSRLAPDGVMVIIDHASVAPWSWNEAGTTFPTPRQTLHELDLDGPDANGRTLRVEQCVAATRTATGPAGETATVTDNIIVVRAVHRSTRPNGGAVNKELTRESGEPWDVVVIGGGVAGLSAALTLARVRRSVLVIDAGEPRNAPAAEAHGLLSRDGIAPLELLRVGRDEVASYGGQVVSGRVSRVSRDGEKLAVTTEDGRRATARRLLVTTGLVDELPPVPGLAQRWGRDVLHCPYCHGWEVRDSTIGVLNTGPSAFPQALMFRQLSPQVTVFLHTGDALAEEQRQQLAALGVGLVEGEVVGLEIDDARDQLTGVRLASGDRAAVDALVVAPIFVARAGMLDDVGLSVAPHPMGLGVQLASDQNGFTGVAGIWAAGNVKDVLAGVPASAASGMQAATAINMDLLIADATAAVAAAQATRGA